MPISRNRIQRPGSSTATTAPPPRPSAAPAKPPAPAAKPPKPVAGDADAKTSIAVAATCGHDVTFTIKPNQNAKVQTAKQRDRPCGPCRDAEDKAKQKPKLPKNLDPARDAESRAMAKKLYASKSPYGWGEPGDLPVGAVMVLTQLEDRTWMGQCSAEGVTVQTVGVGPARQIPWLAGLWLEAKGKTTGVDQ